MVICCFFINVYKIFPSSTFSRSRLLQEFWGVFLELLKNSNWNTRWLWNHPRIHKELCCRLLLLQNSDRRSWRITKNNMCPLFNFALYYNFLTFGQNNCLFFNFSGRNFDLAEDGNGILYKKAAGFAYNVSQPCFHVFFFLFVPYFYLCHTLIVVKVSKSKPFFASIAQSSPPNLIRLCCPLCRFSEANN